MYVCVIEPQDFVNILFWARMGFYSFRERKKRGRGRRFLNCWSNSSTSKPYPSLKEKPIKLSECSMWWKSDTCCLLSISLRAAILLNHHDALHFSVLEKSSFRYLYALFSTDLSFTWYIFHEGTHCIWRLNHRLYGWNLEALSNCKFSPRLKCLVQIHCQVIWPFTHTSMMWT